MATTGVWVVTPKGLIPKHLYSPGPVARSDLPAPMVIKDSLDSVLNMADGRRYDSKRAYEKAVRAKGCEIIGNEMPSASARPEMPDPTPDIIRAIEMAEARAPKPRKRKGRKTA